MYPVWLICNKTLERKSLTADKTQYATTICEIYLKSIIKVSL